MWSIKERWYTYPDCYNECTEAWFLKDLFSVIRKEPTPANQLVLSSEPIRISVKYSRSPACFQSTPMSSELTDSGIFARRFIFSSYFHLSLVEKTKIPWHMPPVSAFLYSDRFASVHFDIGAQDLNSVINKTDLQSGFKQMAYPKWLKNGLPRSLCSSFKFMAVTHHHLRVLNAQDN